MHSKLRQIRNVTVSMSLLLVATFFCACNKTSDRDIQTDTPAKEESSIKNKDVISMIKSYFKSKELKYGIETEDDGTTIFIVRFHGDNTDIIINVFVMPEINLYQIIGSMNATANPNQRQNVLNAINECNCEAEVTNCYLSDNGRIKFWIGRNIDGDTFSEEAFAADFLMVVTDTEQKTPKLLM